MNLLSKTQQLSIKSQSLNNEEQGLIRYMRLKELNATAILVFMLEGTGEIHQNIPEVKEKLIGNLWLGERALISFIRQRELNIKELRQELEKLEVRAKEKFELFTA